MLFERDDGTFGFCSKALLPFFAGGVLRDGAKACQQLGHMPDLVGIHRVAHAGVDALGHLAAQPAENVARSHARVPAERVSRHPSSRGTPACRRASPNNRAAFPADRSARRSSPRPRRNASRCARRIRAQGSRPAKSRSVRRARPDSLRAQAGRALRRQSPAHRSGAARSARAARETNTDTRSHAARRARDTRCRAGRIPARAQACLRNCCRVRATGLRRRVLAGASRRRLRPPPSHRLGERRQLRLELGAARLEERRQL